MSRSCENVTTKCDLLPLVNNILDDRKIGKLGKLGPCVFQTIDDFLKNKKYTTFIPTHIPIIEDQSTVAIGDIHGDLLVLLGVLNLMGVIDKNGEWIGGNTIVVQCGDLLDREGRTSSERSDNTREEIDIIQYMYALNKSAQQDGGGIYWCLGNHDLIRVFWDSSYLDYVGNQIEGWGGEQNMIKLFQPGGQMALYMAYNTILILKVGEFVFLHGGFSIESIKEIKATLNIKNPEDVFSSINKNIRLSLEMPSFKLNENIMKIAWNRTLSKPPIESKEAINTCNTEMKQIFKEVEMNWDKGAFVVGHSVQYNIVPVYCDGRVWRIDLGMSDAFKGVKHIPRVIGGIKIFQYKKKPFIVLTITNFSNGKDKFVLFLNKGYKKILQNPNDDTKISTKWSRLNQDINKIYKSVKTIKNEH